MLVIIKCHSNYNIEYIMVFAKYLINGDQIRKILQNFFILYNIYIL